MTTPLPIHRLHHQHLLSKTVTAPENLVRYMGAMQAQDYAMVKWAIGCRLENACEREVEEAMADGRIIRTHLLRPTWHVVAAEDLRWMLGLTAPHVKRIMRTYDRQVGLDEKVHLRAQKLIEKELAKGEAKTRKELVAVLDRSRIPTDEFRAAHIMMQAELNALVCSGPRRDKQQTYMLVDARVPAGKKLTRDEALHELALRYFTARGPATIADFSWWSGLSVVDSKHAVEMLGDLLYKESIGESTYFHNSLFSGETGDTLHLLPSYDEFLISYSDRTASIDPKHARRALTNNGIFRPVVVKDGTVIGTWSRNLGPKGVRLDFKFFKAKERLSRKVMGEVIEGYKWFLGKE